LRHCGAVEDALGRIPRPSKLSLSAALATWKFGVRHAYLEHRIRFARIM